MRLLRYLDKLITNLFTKERAKLMKAYENHFSSFESRVEHLLSHKDVSECRSQGVNSVVYCGLLAYRKWKC